MRKTVVAGEHLAALILEALECALASRQWEVGDNLLRAIETLCHSDVDGAYLDAAYSILAKSPSQGSRHDD